MPAVATPGTPRLRRSVCYLAWIVGLVAGALASPSAWAADYAGKLIDAHAHLPNATAIEAYVDAMKRHKITKVVLLGVGGAQRSDAAWIAAAARKHPNRVIPGLPLANPTAETAAEQLEAALAKKGARVIGEVHIREKSRKIDRDPSDGPFSRVLEVAGKRGVPIVVHDELDDRASASLESALGAHRNAIVILAHAGSTSPARLEGLLTRNANLMADLSGMHFDRKPSLASETGPLDAEWKALIRKMPDRFMIGIDVSTPKLFEPVMLDRLMKWTRRILGELKDDAERVAYKNAAKLFHVE